MAKKIGAALSLVFITMVGLLVLLECPAAAEDYLDHYEQGEFSLAIEKWDRAIDHFTKAIQDNPSFFRAYHSRAIALSKKGDYDRSIEDLQKAVELNPDYTDAYGLMGLVYENKRDYGTALSMYEAAMARERRPAMRKILEKYIDDARTRLKAK